MLTRLLLIIRDLFQENCSLVNFVIVIDSNGKRRTSFIETIKQNISPVQGLSVTTCTNGTLSSIWASGPWTPINHLNDEQGIATIWGDAIDQNGSQRITAEQLRSLWDNPSTRMPPAFDGFHAGFVYNNENRLIVGADLLGLFPIYYYTSNDVLLVGSSPELFKFHVCFKKELNPAGLVGIFLTNGLICGQTLLKGVKRLNAGHLLTCRAGEKPRELEQYTIPISTKYFELSLSEQLNLLDKALERAVIRHAPIGTRYCISLSGGLDSRILGGYFKKNAIDTVALTTGLPQDIEMKCATKVAKKLGFEHYKKDVEFKKFVFCAEQKVKWEQLSNGFSDVSTWSLCLYLQKIAPRVVTGYLGDSILGSRVHNKSFEADFKILNDWGFSPNTLKKILKQEVFDDYISKTIAKIKKDYGKYSKLEFQKTYCLFLLHRHRFHVGSGAWVLSFGAWPVLPFVDSQVLQILAGMPLSTIEGRRLEKELLCKKFPQLAKLPLDRNFYDTTPLDPTILQRAKQKLYGNNGIWSYDKARSIRNKLINRGGEKRYYFRVYDFNNPGWLLIRKKVESSRELAAPLVDKNALDELFPEPDVNVTFKEGIKDSASLKTMAGFLLWLEQNEINTFDEV